MDYKGLETYFLNKLKKELPLSLRYHDVEHVRDVITASERLGKLEGLKLHDLILLKTAALFHDSGFLIQRENHEDISCKIARDELPAWGYTQEDIEIICRTIRATKLPQKAETLLEKILADADLDYLGRTDYAEISHKLYLELHMASLLHSTEEWQKMQEEFLQKHTYFTKSARNLRQGQKEKNLKSLQHMSKKHHGPLFSGNDILFLILSVLSASFALKSFLVPNHFLDGGVTGISILLYEIYGWDLGLLLLLLNLPFIVLSWYKVGRNFAIRSTLTIVLIAITMQYMQFPELTHDKLLVAMFGGFFMGIGVGLGMRGGGTFDGMEVLVLMTTKKSSFSITELILGMNICIFVIAAIFMKVETALYAILTYIIASLTTKYVIEGIEAYTGVTIVSGESAAIKKALVLELDRGITIYKGERGFMKDSFDKSTEVDIIFTVVTRLEVRRLKNTVYAIDPKAFIFTQTVREPQGGIVKEIVKH